MKDFYHLNRQLASWYNSISEIEKIIMELNFFENILIWGAGMHTEKLYCYSSFFYKFKKSNFIIVDSDKSKRFKTWRGIRIYSPKIIDLVDWSCSGVLISSYASQDEIFDHLLSLNVPPKNIIKLYDKIERY